MKLNNNDITVVPRYIDDSMLPTVDSIANDTSNSLEEHTLESKKKEEKWYIKYKWYIAGVVVVVVFILFLYFFMNKPSTLIEEKIDQEEVKKIKSNIIMDNESISSDLFYNKRLTPILEEDEHNDSVDNWIDKTREELINNDVSSHVSEGSADSKMEKIFIEDLKGLEESKIEELNDTEELDKKNDLSMSDSDEE